MDTYPMSCKSQYQRIVPVNVSLTAERVNYVIINDIIEHDL